MHLSPHTSKICLNTSTRKLVLPGNLTSEGVTGHVLTLARWALWSQLVVKKVRTHPISTDVWAEPNGDVIMVYLWVCSRRGLRRMSESAEWRRVELGKLKWFFYGPRWIGPTGDKKETRIDYDDRTSNRFNLKIRSCAGSRQLQLCANTIIILFLSFFLVTIII